MVDRQALAERLAQIVEDTSGRWPGILRADAKTYGPDDLNPEDLSDDAIKAALRRRILSRRPEPLGHRATPDEIEAAHNRLRQHMLKAVFGDNPSPPDWRDLAALLAEANTGTWPSEADQRLGAAQRYATAHMLVVDGQLTDKGRSILELLADKVQR